MAVRDTYLFPKQSWRNEGLSVFRTLSSLLPFAHTFFQLDEFDTPSFRPRRSLAAKLRISLFFATLKRMGGERSSTARQRLAGKICCVCKVWLPPDPTGIPRERYCDRCAPRRRAYMHFMNAQGGWQCQFLEEDLKTPLPKKLTLQTSDKIMELAERGGAAMNLEGRQVIQHGIAAERGGVWLKLTGEQYERLKGTRS
jgi:hypothetical protein